MNVEVKLTGMKYDMHAGSLIGTMRANFSVSHLLAAASFSRAVGKLQSDNEGRPFDDFFEDIQYNAIATVLTATAALELLCQRALCRSSYSFFPTSLHAFWKSSGKPMNSLANLGKIRP